MAAVSGGCTNGVPGLEFLWDSGFILWEIKLPSTRYGALSHPCLSVHLAKENFHMILKADKVPWAHQVRSYTFLCLFEVAQVPEVGQ